MSDTNTVTFQKEKAGIVLEIKEDGFFYYNGEKVEDINNVYGRMCEFLEASGYPKPKEGETLVHTEKGTEVTKS